LCSFVIKKDIEKGDQMQAEMEQQLVKEILDELESDNMVLPSLPDVALKVRDAIEEEDVTSGKIAKVITTDAALTARLIQVANSPLVRGNKEITSIEAAVTRMGNAMVRNIVNGLIVKQMFQPTTEVSDRKFRAFWQHSAQVAAISHSLAGFARLKPDQALLAGLVHDIGALPVIKRAEDMPVLLENEAMLDSIIASTHTKIGAAMLQKWDFPEALVAVPAEHENLTRELDGAADYVDIVTVANLQSYVGEQHPHAQVDWNTVPAFAKLGLDTEVQVVDMDEGQSIQEIQDMLLG
jgi:putative nucleotidyltransferase with HDIG domain